jgi:hypothetical protein
MNRTPMVIMPTLMGKMIRLARSPEGRRFLAQAQAAARSPQGRKALARAEQIARDPKNRERLARLRSRSRH